MPKVNENDEKLKNDQKYPGSWSRSRFTRDGSLSTTQPGPIWSA